MTSGESRLARWPVHSTSISPQALKVLYRLKDAGYQAFLVGGSVRDLLLGLTPKDFDVATDARPEEVRRLFDLRDSFEWRGLGFLPRSALKLRDAFAAFDAEARFGLVEQPAKDNPACECGAILRGVKKPAQCKLFGTACTPETPMGSCMVSPEGACSAHWTYGRFRERAKEAAE